MHLTSLLLPLILLFHRNHQTYSAFMRNKYQAEVELIEACPDNDKLESPLRNVQFIRYNRTVKVLNLDVTYHRPIDANVGTNYVAERWSDGGWKRVPFIAFQEDSCQTGLLFFREIWVRMNRALGVPKPDECPIPPGNYSLKNFVVDVEKQQIPFFSGRIRFTSSFETVDKRKRLFCMVQVFAVTEKY